MRESINNTGTDAKASKGTRTGHESDFGNIFEVFIIFL